MDFQHLIMSNGVSKTSLEMESVKLEMKPLVISILGTGEFGRALGSKIFETCSKSAVRVIFGTRNPDGCQIRFPGLDQPVDMFTHDAAISKSGNFYYCILFWWTQIG